MKSLILSCLAFILPLCAMAQAGKPIVVVGDSIRNADQLFVGEIHSITERAQFNAEIVRFAYNNYGITNIVKEMGKSFCYLTNRYIQNDDTTILRYKFSPHDREMVEEWRAINRTLPKDKQITLYGIDFERMDFILSLQSIFRRNEGAKNTALCKYINSLPDSFCVMNSLKTEHKDVRIATYTKAREIFKEEKETLRSLVKEDFNVMEDILENPCTERHFGLRDKYMAENLRKQVGDKKFVCIIGKYHTELRRIDIHRSVMKQYMRRSGNTPVLIAEVYDIEDEAGYMKNDSLIALVHGKYHDPKQYTLINENIFRNAAGKRNSAVPTYCVFFDEINPDYRSPW